MSDKFYVYRPLLDLIGFTEGTDKGDGYNETLAYGKMADGVKTKGKGKDVALVDMTLKELDAFQTLMLRDPDNNWKSSACGRYQIVRTTARNIRKVLPDQYPAERKFDATCQDEMACYLLGVRGIDKYLAGRMKEDTLINNLAKEWASLPTTANKGYYGGQHAAVKATGITGRFQQWFVLPRGRARLAFSSLSTTSLRRRRPSTSIGKRLGRSNLERHSPSDLLAYRNSRRGKQRFGNHKIGLRIDVHRSLLRHHVQDRIAPPLAVRSGIIAREHVNRAVWGDKLGILPAIRKVKSRCRNVSCHGENPRFCRCRGNDRASGAAVHI